MPRTNEEQIQDFLVALDNTHREAFLAYAENTYSVYEIWLYAGVLGYEGSFPALEKWLKKAYPKLNRRERARRRERAVESRRLWRYGIFDVNPRCGEISRAVRRIFKRRVIHATQFLIVFFEIPFLLARANRERRRHREMSTARRRRLTRHAIPVPGRFSRETRR